MVGFNNSSNKEVVEEGEVDMVTNNRILEVSTTTLTWGVGVDVGQDRVILKIINKNLIENIVKNMEAVTIENNNSKKNNKNNRVKEFFRVFLERE